MTRHFIRRAAIVATVAASLALAGCGRSYTDERGKTYGTYGLLNANTAKHPNVCYELSIGNLIWSVILIETIVFPIYFFGFSIFNPVRTKRSADDACGAL